MKKNIWFTSLLLSFCLSIPAFSYCRPDDNISGQEHSQIKNIYIIPVTGTIDLGLSAYIKRAAEEAKLKNADAVVFDINTFGGRVDAADEMVTTISEIYPIPTFAYVSHSAWSAGALIAIACKDITMQTGASIGSAEPRIMGLPNNQQNQTDEKMISALRAEFKSTAEANGHSPNLAQAMVDMSLEIIQIDFEGNTLLLTRTEFENLKNKNSKKSITNERIICPKDRLLNLTSIEAKALGLSNETFENKTEFYDYLKLKLYNDKNIKLNVLNSPATWSENLVRFLTHPLISPLLLSLGFLGILFELKMPGWGISGTLGAVFIVLFFWGHYLVGLADFADIGIFLLGVILIGVELLYIPGFGFLGFAGVFLMSAGLILMLVKQPFKFPSFEFNTAFYTIAKAFALTMLIGFLGIKYLPKTGMFKKLLLNNQERTDLGFTTKSLSEKIRVGTIGVSKSMLRPTGRAVFEKNVIDVCTRGEFIAKAIPIEIVKIDGNKVIVKEAKNADMA